MNFDFVPDELKHVAAGCGPWFVDRGYTVDDQDDDLSFPLAPSLSARRGDVLCIVEVVDAVDKERLERWILYCKACEHGARLHLAIDASCPERASVLEFATSCGLGMLVFADGEGVSELVPARDLAAPTNIPSLAHEPDHVRRALGGALESFERGEWKDGLRDAIRAFEELCRARLEELINQGVHFSPVPGRKKPPMAADVAKATLGSLEIFYAMISPTTAEVSSIIRVIGHIRDPRNDLAHQNSPPAVKEKAIKLFYVVIRGVRDICL